MSTKFKLLLTAFVALAILYSLVIPLFEGPDEDDHFRFTKFIADQHALPVQLFQVGGGQAGHQGWQPPLYYSLAALVIAPLDTTDYADHLWRNEAGTFVGDPACCGRNIYYHTDSENLPFTRTTLAVHLARLLSILFGAITVYATYALARIIVPAQEWLALAAASVVAFNPSFLFASALVSNDAALAAWSSLVLLLCVKIIFARQLPMLRSVAVLGVLVSGAVLTKTTALGLIALAMPVLAVIAWRARNLRWGLWANVTLLATVGLLTGWWFARNWILYGDPLALRLVSETALFPRSGPLTVQELAQISLPWLWQTFWGGPTPGDFSPILLIVLALVTSIALVGSVLIAIRNSQFAIRASLFLLVTWLAIILVAQIQFIRMTTGADQGRYLFPAISAIAFFFVLGLDEIARRISRISNLSFVTRLLVIFIFPVLAVCVLFVYTLPAYARPPLLSENDLARVSHPLEINFANRIELRGYGLSSHDAKPGDSLDVELDWRALAPMNESYRVFVHLIGANDRSAGGADVIPARGAFPTVYWKPGDALRDVVHIPITANAIPGKYRIEVGLYPVDQSSGRLVIVDSGDESVILDSIKIAPRQPVIYTPQTRLQAKWQFAELIGYDATRDAQTLTLTLYWQALAKVDNDYSVFVHVLDDSGKIVAQSDQQPQAGHYPTSIWDAGEQIRDEYILALPNANANYTVRIGLYRADTNARLSLNDGTDFVEFKLVGK